ncbi:MAG: type I glutamate--ammonia ligase [Dehalococcoidia bacterium]|nr:type I glutamate--ammonia ligase [Dehalococcoidia bacterium]
MELVSKPAEVKPKEILKKAEADGVRFVNLQFTDVVGVVKSVTIPIEQLPDAIDHGKWFDGSSIEGFARIAESDMYLVPDLATYRVIPWERGENTTARVICWVHTPGGEAFAGDPRVVLMKAVAEAAEMGYVYNTGPELEFFLFKSDGLGRIAPLPHDRGGYFDLSTDLAAHVRKEMVNVLADLGIKVETAHHEVAMGQHEIDFQYDNALATADNAVTFKYALKAVAQKHGLHTTFMPKPIFGTAGNGMHCHQSLALLDGGRNAFADANDEYGLSSLAKHFIAGQLHHARAMCAVLAPLVNSYKRLVAGYEAPVYVSWASINRSALIRVPKFSPGKLDATRIELRCPDPSCNPYLAFAVMLKCGLDGVKNKMVLPPAVEENLYTFDEAEIRRRQVQMLPGSLGEAIEEMKTDEVVREALGEHVYERFLEAKAQEWAEYKTYVSPWELDRYLEVF